MDKEQRCNEIRDYLDNMTPGYSRKTNNNKITQLDNTETEEIPLECKKALWEAKKKVLSQLIDINKKKNQLDNKVDK